MQEKLNLLVIYFQSPLQLSLYNTTGRIDKCLSAKIPLSETNSLKFTIVSYTTIDVLLIKSLLNVYLFLNITYFTYILIFTFPDSKIKIFPKGVQLVSAIATYKISKLWALWFQRRRFLNFFPIVSLWRLSTPGAWPNLTPGA